MVSCILCYSLFAMTRAFVRVYENFVFDEAESPDLNSFTAFLQFSVDCSTVGIAWAHGIH